MSDGNKQGGGMVLYERAAVTTIPDAKNLRNIATELLNSGLYPHVKNATQAIAIIATGQELGLGPTASLQNISIVNGKMCAESKVWQALFHKSGGKTKILKRDKKSCKIEFTKPGREAYIHEYTAEMADAEGLIRKGGAWSKMLETMLQWRCMSNGIRAYDPGVTMGISLTVEEAHDYPNGIPTENGAKKSEPIPEPTPEPEKPAEAISGPVEAESEEVSEPEEAGEFALEQESEEEEPPPVADEDDPLAGENVNESEDVGEAVVKRIKAVLATQGVDEKAFKAWLYEYQGTMKTPRKFLTKMKNAIRFDRSNITDLDYLLVQIDSAIGVFHAQTRKGPESE